MKVLFLSVTAGNGHNSCAKALGDLLEQNGIQTYSLDLYGYIHKALAKTVSDLYDFSINKIPQLYGILYNKEEYSKISIGGLMDQVNKLAIGKITEFITENEIDTVITTHVFGAQLITKLKKKGKIDLLSAGVVTDYTIHPHWEKTDLDFYVIAEEGLVRQAVTRGIPREKILPIGIPLGMKFSEKRDKREAKRKLGLDESLPLVLIMMGSMGYGNIGEVAKEVDRGAYDYQILIVCGNNKRAKASLEHRSFTKPVRVYGFADNVDELMDAADCIITKPGGLTVTESLAKGLPMIYMDPIPGQEVKNVEFLVNNGAGIYVSENYPLADALDQFFRYPERREEMKVCVNRLSKPDAAAKLLEILKEEYGRRKK